MRKTQPVKPDPIYTAIEEHKAAWGALDVATGTLLDAEANLPERKVYKATDDAERKATKRLMTIRPCTTEGVFALARYIVTMEDSSTFNEHPYSLESIVKNIAAGLAKAGYKAA